MMTNYLHRKSKTILLCLIVVFNGYSCVKHGEVERESPHWDYEHPDWQSLGYSECDDQIQTPINIESSKTIDADLDSVIFNYAPFPMKIVDNGHTVQVSKSGNAVTTMTVDGVVYNFLQFHYHTKSEHAIDGKLNDMEIHLVHQDPVSKTLAVVGIMLTDDAAGADHPFIDLYQHAFPAEKLVEVTTTTDLDLNDILPVDRQYYAYTGSLTTPPCSQGLKWIVLKGKVQVSTAQIAEISEHHGHNNRPLQPIGNRIILEKK